MANVMQREQHLEARLAKSLFAGEVTAVSDENPPRYTITATVLGNTIVVENVEETIRNGGSAAGIRVPYRVGDRVLVATPRGRDTSVILGGLAQEGKYQDNLPKVTITAHPANTEPILNNPLAGALAFSLLTFSADPDLTIDVNIPTQEARFVHDKAVVVDTGGQWRTQVTPERLNFIRVLDADYEDGVIRQDGWVFYDVPLIGAQWYYSFGIQGIAPLRYHTYPTIDLRATIATPLPPPLSALVFLNNIHLPHRHQIPVFPGWQPFRLIWRKGAN